MRPASPFCVPSEQLASVLSIYPEAVAAPLRNASDAEVYRIVRRCVRFVAVRFPRTVASSPPLCSLLDRVASSDPTLGSPQDLVHEAAQLRELLESQEKADCQQFEADQLSPGAYLPSALRVRLAHLACAALLSPPAGALASTLVALENLYQEVEGQADFCRLLRLRDRVLATDTPGPPRPWPPGSYTAYQLGPRMRAPLEHARDETLRRLALTFARVAATSLPPPRPRRLLQLLRACRQYLTDQTQSIFLLNTHNKSIYFANWVDIRRNRLGQRVGVSSAYRKCDHQLSAIRAIESATDPDVLTALGWSFQHTVDALEHSRWDARRKRIARILKVSISSQ